MKAKELIYLLIVLAIIMLAIKRCCRNGFVTPPGNLDTMSVRVDTIYTEAKTDTVYIPRLVKTTVYVPTVDTFIEYSVEVLPSKTDTAKLIKDYFAVREYVDTQKIKYGVAIITDKVQGNKIFNRHFILEQKIPEITRTIVAIEHEKKKRWGIGLQAGYQINGKPTISAGISYNFIRF